MDKKTIIIAGGSLIGVLIVILVGTFIFSSIAPKNYDYETVEGMISEAAKKYYKANPTMLPKNDGEQTLAFEILVESSYIKPLNKLLKNGDTCTASVIVSKYGDNYSYIPYLTCPGDYETQELYRVILNDNRTVSEGVGLYEESGRNVFRGEVKNNYVLINEILWRIISVEDDRTVKIIRSEPAKKYYAWDDRYNLDIKKSYGYNYFEVSRLKEHLQTLASEEEILTEVQKGKFVAKNLCIGSREKTSIDRTIQSDCTVMSEDKFLYGVILPGDYYTASIDEDCLTVSPNTCKNYNYLAKMIPTSSTWTSVALANDTGQSFYLFNGSIETGYCNTRRSLYPVGYLSNRAFYKSGTGTETDPYIIR